MLGTLASFRVGSKVLMGGRNSGLCRGNSRVQVIQGHDHVGCGPQGIFGLVRPGGMALLPQERHLEPEDALFRHLDHGAVIAAGIGHDDQVPGGKQAGVLPQQVGQTFVVAGFFVRHQGQGQGALRGDPQIQKGPHGHEGHDDAVMVVFRAPPVEAVALHPEGKGIGLPEAHIPRGHHVHVAQDPDLLRSFAGQIGHQVGADAARAPGHPGPDSRGLQAPNSPAPPSGTRPCRPRRPPPPPAPAPPGRPSAAATRSPVPDRYPGARSRAGTSQLASSFNLPVSVRSAAQAFQPGAPAPARCRRRLQRVGGTGRRARPHGVGRPPQPGEGEDRAPAWRKPLKPEKSPSG